MSIVCPTVITRTSDPHAYREQIERVGEFANRVQIDLMDGKFAPHKNLNPIQLWWPERVEADIHLMYQQPGEHLETLISLKPSLIILHAEADGDMGAYIEHIQKFGIRVGVALLQHTSVMSCRNYILAADHVLVFAGTLGESSQNADMGCLSKIAQIKQLKPEIEIGWDGGITHLNAMEIAESGVNVLNVGGAIQNAVVPREAYRQLVSLVDGIR